MNATVEINLNNAQGWQFLQYAKTLPFARVIEDAEPPRSVWQQAVDEGAVSVDAFFDELNTRIEKWPDNA